MKVLFPEQPPEGAKAPAATQAFKLESRGAPVGQACGVKTPMEPTQSKTVNHVTLPQPADMAYEWDTLSIPAGWSSSIFHGVQAEIPFNPTEI